MKKLLILLTVLVVAGSAEAKIRVGLKGGLNFASFPESVVHVFDNRTGWHIGGMMNISFPFGLTLQPELLYSVKGTNWGPKILIAPMGPIAAAIKSKSIYRLRRTPC